VAEIPIGRTVADLVSTPDGTHLLAVDEEAGELVVLRRNGAGLKVARRLAVGPGPIGVAVGLVFGIPAERMVRTSIVIRNASITELRFRSQGFDWQPDQLSLVTFNLTAHLPEELQTER